MQPAVGLGTNNPQQATLTDYRESFSVVSDPFIFSVVLADQRQELRIGHLVDGLDADDPLAEPLPASRFCSSPFASPGPRRRIASASLMRVTTSS